MTFGLKNVGATY
jgi:hypothetical protein